jgi:hypothetical protein
MDRLNFFLKQDDAVLFVCGYSFGDEHINERILSALQTNTTAHVFAFDYDIVWSKGENGEDVKKHTFSTESNLGKLASRNRKISVLATRTAIIGGQIGKWRIRNIDTTDPLNLTPYFKEDVMCEIDIETGEQTGIQPKTREGEFLLPDFVSFVNLLKSMVPGNEWEDNGNE